MKNLITTIFASIMLLFTASNAVANSNVVQGKIVSIDPIYTNTQQQKPKQVCQEVEVPIYGRTGGGNAGEGALGGMIIGGVLGKVLGGNDKGAAAGAILGGVVGANNSQGQRVITGYRKEFQCNTTYTYVNTQVINEYNITYRVGGNHRITMRVNRAVGESAYVGQRKDFRVTYRILN
jgi:uncharacterized protein YcfJ